MLFERGFAAATQFYALPELDWTRLRTTDGLERLPVEIKAPDPMGLTLSTREGARAVARPGCGRSAGLRRHLRWQGKAGGP